MRKQKSRWAKKPKRWTVEIAALEIGMDPVELRQRLNEIGVPGKRFTSQQMLAAYAAAIQSIHIKLAALYGHIVE